MLLARHGYDVLVVDRTSLPADTVSTHSLSRGGIVQLQRWGLLDAVIASGAPPVRRVVFHTGGSSVTRQIKEHAGVDLTVAPRRHILDAILANAAVDAGAQLTVPLRVKGTTRDDGGRVTGIFGDSVDGPLELRARFVIGADGVRSRIARSVGAATLLSRSPAGATHYAYFAGPRWDAVEYFVGDRSFSGIFPTHHGEACVWVCLPAEDAAAHRQSGEPREVTFDRMISTRPRCSRNGSETPRARHRCASPLVSPTTCCRPPVPAGRWSAMPAITGTRSPVTASPMPSATPSFWPTRSTAHCRVLRRRSLRRLSTRTSEIA